MDSTFIMWFEMVVFGESCRLFTAILRQTRLDIRAMAIRGMAYQADQWWLLIEELPPRGLAMLLLDAIGEIVIPSCSNAQEVCHVNSFTTKERADHHR